MSILGDILNRSERVAVVNSYNSLDSLVRSILPTPVTTPQEVNLREEKVEPEIVNESVISSLNEEIHEDLKKSFTEKLFEGRSDNFYKIYRDREETFECKISVEGSSINSAYVRLVLESEQWNLFFPGKIYRDGRCVVPLKKMTIFQEGLVGKAKLEVVIEDVVFVPWEETFIVEGSKKVTVEVKPQTKVSVNFNE